MKDFYCLIEVKGVYIPNQANVGEAELNTCLEVEHTDSLVIILGDFNREKLNHKLP